APPTGMLVTRNNRRSGCGGTNSDAVVRSRSDRSAVSWFIRYLVSQTALRRRGGRERFGALRDDGLHNIPLMVGELSEGLPLSRREQRFREWRDRGQNQKRGRPGPDSAA